MTTAQPHADDRVLLGTGRFAHLVHAATTGVHAHHALKLCIPLEGELGAGLAPGRASVQGRGALLVAPHVRQWAGCNGAVLSLFVEPERLAGRRLHTAGLDWIAGARLEALVQFARRELDHLDGAEALDAFVDEALERLGLGLAHAPPLDRRVVRVQRILDEAPRHLVPAAELAARVGLSPSHLAHLFRAQVGIPVRHYGLWQRTLSGLAAVVHTGRVGEAAHAAGFADQAHFTRTCQRMFGQPPSMVPPAPGLSSEDRRIVQARVGRDG